MCHKFGFVLTNFGGGSKHFTVRNRASENCSLAELCSFRFVHLGWALVISYLGNIPTLK